jgi:hypothetical protein
VSVLALRQQLVPGPLVQKAGNSAASLFAASSLVEYT